MSMSRPAGRGGGKGQRNPDKASDEDDNRVFDSEVEGFRPVWALRVH